MGARQLSIDFTMEEASIRQSDQAGSPPASVYHPNTSFTSASELTSLAQQPHGIPEIREEDSY